MCLHPFGRRHRSLAVALLLLASMAFGQRDRPLTNADIIAMSKADLGDDVILAKIQQAPAEAFDVEADTLLALKKVGVSRAVINAMIKRAGQRSASQAPASVPASASPGQAIVPKSIGVIYHLDAAHGTLMPLERQMGLSERRGMIRHEVVVAVAQEHSNVRLKSSQPMEFVVAGVDPNGYRLLRFTLHEGKREVILAESTWTGARGNYVVVAFDATKYGDAYRLTPVQALWAGEYAFFPKGANDAFCFGVDADTSGGAAPQGTLVPRVRGGAYSSPIVVETDFAAADRSLWNGGKEFTIQDWWELGKVSCDGLYLRGESDRKTGWESFLNMRARDLANGDVEVTMSVSVQNPKHNEDKLVTLLVEILNGEKRVASETVKIKAKDNGDGNFKSIVFKLPRETLVPNPMPKLRLTMDTVNY